MTHDDFVHTFGLDSALNIDFVYEIEKDTYVPGFGHVLED